MSPHEPVPFGALIEICPVVSLGDNYPADEAFGPFSYPNLPHPLPAAIIAEFVGLDLTDDIDPVLRPRLSKIPSAINSGAMRILEDHNFHTSLLCLERLGAAQIAESSSGTSTLYSSPSSINKWFAGSGCGEIRVSLPLLKFVRIDTVFGSALEGCKNGVLSVVRT